MRKVNWKDEITLRYIVLNSKNKTETLKCLGLQNIGANYKTLQRYIKKYNISIEHFEINYHRMVLVNKESKIPLKDILVKNSSYSRSLLRKRLIDEKILKYRCAICGNSGKWKGKVLTLQIEHKNGINNDNRVENLEFLCPNCHTQTNTFAGRNLPNAGTGKWRPKFGNRTEYLKIVKQKYKEEQQQYVEKILNSEIDFSRLGWVKQVALIINQKPQKVKDWMEKIMPDFYKHNCFKRKSRLEGCSQAV